LVVGFPRALKSKIPFARAGHRAKKYLAALKMHQDSFDTAARREPMPDAAQPGLNPNRSGMEFFGVCDLASQHCAALNRALAHQ
jgi:hypothetical protein